MLFHYSSLPLSVSSFLPSSLFPPHSSPTLFPYTLPLHSSPTLFPYTLPLHSSTTLFLYTLYLYYTLPLHSSSTLFTSTRLFPYTLQHKYHEDFEQNIRGAKQTGVDDAEMNRIRSQQVPDYRGQKEGREQMERNRALVSDKQGQAPSASNQHGTPLYPCSYLKPLSLNPL